MDIRNREIPISSPRGGDLSPKGQICIVAEVGRLVVESSEPMGNLERCSRAWLPSGEIWDAAYVGEAPVFLASTRDGPSIVHSSGSIALPASVGHFTTLYSALKGPLIARGSGGAMLLDSAFSPLREYTFSAADARGGVLAVATDGSLVAAAGVVAEEVCVYCVGDGREVARFPIPSSCATHLALSPTGEWLFAGHDAYTWNRLWNVRTGASHDLDGWIGDGWPGGPGWFSGDELVQPGGFKLLVLRLDGQEFVEVEGVTPGRIGKYRWCNGTALLCYPDKDIVSILQVH